MIQPVVLVGGKSARFGRDKLREPVAAMGSFSGVREEWLVDRPIAALREVFGARVALAGECEVEVSRRGDLVIEDRYPGVGPIGGIVSALEEGTRQGWDGVFVLAGDLPRVGAREVRLVMEAADRAAAAWAVLGETDRIEACVGVYRVTALGALRARIETGNNRLREALPRERLALVRLDAAAMVNVNRPEDLAVTDTPPHTGSRST